MTGSLGVLASNDLPRCPPWTLWLAGALPLAYYVATASAHGHWNEASALAGATAELGVSYPPGAPVSSLLGSLLSLLPIGPLSFRAAVASAVFVSIALALFCRAVFGSLVGMGVKHHVLSSWLAVGAALLLGQTEAVWSAAVHPNAYAMSLLVSMVALDAVVRFELSQPTDDMRVLSFASFMQGLSFATHHVFALFTLAAGAPTVGRVFARRGFIGLMGHAVAPILGFSAYVYVPIRAAQYPSIDFGEGHRLSQLLWMLGADPFWGPPDAAPANAVACVWHSLAVAGPVSAGVLLACAALGLWLARRASGRRRFAVIWGILLTIPFFSVALLIRPTLEAEAQGALLLTHGAIMALAALGVGLGVEHFASSALSHTAQVVARALVALTLLGFITHASERSLARFDATDALDDATRRTLPPRSVLFTYDMDTVFRHLGAEVEEQLRPDVTVVPLALVREPWLVEALAARSPELTPVLRELVVRGELERSSVQSLSAERPVILELDAHTKAPLYTTLVPEGVFSRVLPDGITKGDAKLAANASLASWRQLDLRLRSLSSTDEARRKLETLRYFQALSAASLGEHDLADALLEPHAAVPVPLTLAAPLRNALLARPGKAVDPSPFVAPEQAALVP